MNLALFDFDGTITSEPSYTGFLYFAVRRRRQRLGGALLLPLILAYRLGLVSQPTIRRAISRVGFWRDDPDRIRALGARYAAETLPGIIRPIALERLAWHRAQGDRIVIVSASLDAYLAPWCEAMDVDVICTTLEVKDGRLTGRYLHGDCCGEEKRRRIRERIDLDGYDAIYAYGDSDEDREMLELADRRFLGWTEIGATATATATEPAIR